MECWEKRGGEAAPPMNAEMNRSGLGGKRKVDVASAAWRGLHGFESVA